ncbi:hypothetical protein F5Y18DRAFT_225878 [Xylariaceae sp. FL1019]|nr:hypothetical protein F5Y18DRAFT_225878 [Xylariaceae sp. FL1019]
MAAPVDDPFGVIQQTYHEILVQTGKHFRAMDGSAGLTGAHSAIRAKTEDSLTQYHFALHDIENEIISAKSVLLRDLEKLRAARIPAPQPVATPAPAPASTPAPVQVKAPMAPMLDLPSAAAHTLKGPSYAENMEPKTAAPFPDMGMGMSMSADIDLSAPVKHNPSPRIQAGSVKPVASRATPPIKTEAKPSPKPAPQPKPTPPAKVTPIPPPQIPRLPPTQQATNMTSANQPKVLPASQPPKTGPSVRPPQNTQIIKTVPENPLDSTPGPPPPNPGAGPGTGNGNGELTFTDMEFSLAPPPNEPQGGAPPAPMPEFDLANFVPPPGPSGVPTATLETNNNDIAMGNTQNASKSNVDDLFNLGNGANDNMFDLGGGEADNSTFDDMMYFGNDNSDMAQFDDAYFGL